jgi:predicted nucleotidyltransferase
MLQSRSLVSLGGVTMIDLLTTHRDEIARLCDAYGAGKLDVFGSAANGDWVPGKSDVDFVVTFDDRSAGYARRWLGLEEALSVLLGVPVDLIIDDAIRNPYFRRAVDRHRERMYERTNRQTAA